MAASHPNESVYKDVKSNFVMLKRMPLMERDMNNTATGILTWDPVSLNGVRQGRGFAILRCGQGWFDLYQHYLDRYGQGVWKNVVDRDRIFKSQFVDLTPHLAYVKPEVVRPNWGPHITFIRREQTNSRLWGKGEGQEIEFTFNPDLKTNGRHWWLQVTCPKLLEIRQALGLNPNPRVPLHMTVGVIPSEND